MNEYRALLTSAAWYQILWNYDRAEAPASWDAVLAIPGVRLHPRAIEIPWTAFELPEVLELCKELDVRPPSIPFKYPTVRTWAPKRAPFAHQFIVTERLLRSGRLLLGDQMGAAKTASAIMAAETVRRHVHHYQRPVFVFAPLRLRNTWKRELLVMGAIENESEFCALESLTMDDASWRYNAKWYFIHYDVVSAWWSRLALLRPCVTIMDEAHLLKNGRAVRTKATSLAFQSAPFRMELTGTPIQNKPQDLWSLLTMLTGERTWGGPIEFRQRYIGAYRTDYGWKDTDPTNVEELQERIAPFWLRRTIQSAGVELPAFTREIVEVEPNPLRAQEYAGRMRTMTPHEARQILQVMLQGSLIKDAIRIIGKLRKVTADAKLTATFELIDTIVEQGESVVVFTWERRTAARIAQYASTLPSALTGEIDIDKRNDYVDTFQAQGGVLVATYGALAEGVTLHKARHVILHDIDWIPGTMLQAEKRVHRIGQDFACKAYWMTAPKLFDSFMLKALRLKLNDAETILDLERAVPELSLGAPDDFEARMQRELELWRAL